MLSAMAAALIATGCGGSSTTSAATPVGCATTGAADGALSADYHYVLNVGPTEEMFSRADVAANHPKNGELMVNGAMTMSQGANPEHLEIHICSRRNGEVVVGPPPAITFTDTNANTTTTLQVATMQGVTSGLGDLHYGNTIDAPPGHAFAVLVGFRGQQATLHFTRPA